MSRWQPMASVVMMAPSITNMSRSAGMAMISLDLSATLTWPSPRRWRAAKADTMWIAAFAPYLVGRGAPRPAGAGDHIRRHPDQLGDPGDEATLEFRGVERRENVAEVVVRRRSIAERQKPAQKRDLLLAEPCNIDEGFRPGEHCEQAQQQHLFERVDHLTALPWVRKIPKTPQKNNRFAVRRRPRNRLHRALRKSNQEDHDRFSTSAVCHALLHPITLRPEASGIGFLFKTDHD